MKLHSLIIDDFLDQFDALRAYADDADYQTIENPVDQVRYPGICSVIPEDVRNEVQDRLSIVTGREIEITYLFMRLSLAGVPVPHQAHTDISMGTYSLMLYLTRGEHCQGGTSLVRHLNGMDRNPISAEEEALWKRDTNEPSQWNPYMTCEMRPNRAFIFDAALMHRAAPLNGFGDSPHNGRLVLTAFFNTVGP